MTACRARWVRTAAVVLLLSASALVGFQLGRRHHRRPAGAVVPRPVAAAATAANGADALPATLTPGGHDAPATTPSPPAAPKRRPAPSCEGRLRGISAERASVEHCLAIPPQVTRHHDEQGVKQAAAIFAGERNIRSMARGLKAKGVLMLAPIANVSRLMRGGEAEARLARADLIYTNHRESMAALKRWQDGQGRAHPSALARSMTNTVEAFFSAAFTSKNGLPAALRSLFRSEGCEMGEASAAHLMPPTVELPASAGDTAAVEACERFFRAQGLRPLSGGGSAKQPLSPRLLLKPTLGSQGKGITLHDSLGSLLVQAGRDWPCTAPPANQVASPAQRQWVVQSYIEPLLLHGRKFDIRLYVLVASTSPTVLFWREGYIRRALQPYDRTAPFEGNEGMHITNTHRQKTLPDYHAARHVWSMTQLRKYIGEHLGVASLRLFNRRLGSFVPWAARVVYEALTASPAASGGGTMGESPDWRRNGTFQLLGLDFMVNEQMEFSFIEGNPRPGLDQETKWQARYMSDMVGEMAEIVFEVQTGRPMDSRKRTVRAVARHRLWAGEGVGTSHAREFGSWRMLWHEGWPRCSSVHATPLRLCAAAGGAGAGAGQPLAIGAGARATAKEWPCLHPRGALPYESYGAAVRRNDAKVEGEQAAQAGPCSSGASNSAAVEGLRRVALIGEAPPEPAPAAEPNAARVAGRERAPAGPQSDSISAAAARRDNCGCLLRTLCAAVPSTVAVETWAPTTPEVLRKEGMVGGRGWKEMLEEQGLVSGSGARLLRKERVSDLATALSHVRLWRDFVDSPRAGQHDSLLVLEDDASLPEDFCWGEVTKRIEAAPAGWAMISLFEFDPYRNRGKKKRLPKSWDSTPLPPCDRWVPGAEMAAASLRVRHHGLGMVGYVLSRAGAEWLLKAALPLEDKAIDQVITQLVRRRTDGWTSDPVLVSHPPLVHHDYLLGSQRRDRNKQAAAAAVNPATVGGDASDAAVEAALEGSEAMPAADAEKDTPLEPAEGGAAPADPEEDDEPDESAEPERAKRPRPPLRGDAGVPGGGKGGRQPPLSADIDALMQRVNARSGHQG